MSILHVVFVIIWPLHLALFFFRTPFLKLRGCLDNTSLDPFREQGIRHTMFMATKKGAKTIQSIWLPVRNNFLYISFCHAIGAGNARERVTCDPFAVQTRPRHMNRRRRKQNAPTKQPNSTLEAGQRIDARIFPVRRKFG